MTVRFNLNYVALVSVLGLGLAIGCGKSEPSKPTAKKDSAPAKKADAHDHGDGSGLHSHGDDPHDVKITEADVKKPADYKDAVARIKAIPQRYRSRRLAAMCPARPIETLDELEIVLKWLPGIARDSSVPKSQWETINTSARRSCGSCSRRSIRTSTTRRIRISRALPRKWMRRLAGWKQRPTQPKPEGEALA